MRTWKFPLRLSTLLYAIKKLNNPTDYILYVYAEIPLPSVYALQALLYAIKKLKNPTDCILYRYAEIPLTF